MTLFSSKRERRLWAWTLVVIVAISTDPVRFWPDPPPLETRKRPDAHDSQRTVMRVFADESEPRVGLQQDPGVTVAAELLVFVVEYHRLDAQVRMPALDDVLPDELELRGVFVGVVFPTPLGQPTLVYPR